MIKIIIFGQCLVKLYMTKINNTVNATYQAFYDQDHPSFNQSYIYIKALLCYPVFLIVTYFKEKILSKRQIYVALCPIIQWYSFLSLLEGNQTLYMFGHISQENHFMKIHDFFI